VTRDEAATISEALRAVRLPHTIEVGFRHGMNPDEQCNVIVVPCLSLAPEDIEVAQAVAISVGRKLAFIGGRFEFVLAGRA
jgi:hypothetical protein